METEQKPDLELKALGGFIGTQQYYREMGALYTDGVKYIMENGYSWFVTDALAVIVSKPRLKAEPFLAVKLKRKDGEATLIIDDGNGKVLYRQHYEWTDAKRDLTLFWENGVLLLASEH